MTRSIGLTTVALLAGLALAPASAQTPSVPDAPPPVVDIYTEADAQAVLDARLIALKTVIRLTPEQSKLWDPLEAAIRQASGKAALRATARTKADPALNFLDVLERIADAEASRAQDLKAVIAAAKPLVASLSEEQKRRIPGFLGMSDTAGKPQPTLELWIFEDEQE
ncbi:MAG TPA: Spy/CpxP family protein refolding chaperone [Xanthobacteraceae bacterium]|nr:Spy/CpxP family protein refolding chaperone [Xanthobacteraceae bacterium]